MAKDRNEDRIKRCGRLAASVRSRPAKPSTPMDRGSIVKKGNDPSVGMGDWVIDEAE